MHFKSLLAVTASLACVSGTIASTEDNTVKRGWSTFDTRQEPAPPATPEDPNASRLVQIVKVGDENGALTFSPDNIRANVGDVVQFHFYPKNHTVTESLFAQPCVPLPDANKTETRPGVKSGFIPVTADTQFRPIFNMIVNDTKPMWLFCGQKPHCQRGMVMVINQNETSTDKTLAKYKEAAAQVAPPSSSAASPPPPEATPPPPAPPATPAGSTATGGSGPSLVGSTTGILTASASIATFTGGANKDLAAWGSTWSVGLLALVGVAVWM